MSFKIWNYPWMLSFCKFSDTLHPTVRTLLDSCTDAQSFNSCARCRWYRWCRYGAQSLLKCTYMWWPLRLDRFGFCLILFGWAAWTKWFISIGFFEPFLKNTFDKLDKVGELSSNKQIQASVKCFDKYDFKIVEAMSRKGKRTKTNRRWIKRIWNAWFTR